MTSNIETIISEPRFSKYLNYSGGNETLASELYQFNLQLSGAAYEALSICEVVLRNSMDRQLRTWNLSDQGTEDWTLDPGGTLWSCFRNDAEELKVAREKATRALRHRQIGHDDVVAQMSFGAWRYLLPPTGRSGHLGKQKIWDEALVKAFPNAGNSSRTTITNWIGIAYDLRNRIAHHEPVFHLDMQTKRRIIKDIIDCVSRDARKWYAANDRMAPTVMEFKKFQSLNKSQLRAP